VPLKSKFKYLNTFFDLSNQRIDNQLSFECIIRSFSTLTD
jgi:hypothetical protein